MKPAEYGEYVQYIPRFILRMNKSFHLVENNEWGQSNIIPSIPRRLMKRNAIRGDSVLPR